ncbi:MAG: trypsin-like peptidase domain-containing protein [Bacteroidetes bacterium]|nr:trypsin-like peptidase domain-containing protein [Bacteroidota bacterium]
MQKAIKFIRNITLFLFASLVLFGCRTTNLNKQPELAADNKYDSEFPSKSVSSELDYISKTVKKLDILAFYATYYFPKGSNINKKNINDSLLVAYSATRTISHESVSGTASVIYNNQDLIGFLTCAHIIDFNDSIFSYYNDDVNEIQTVSIKIKQQNHIGSLGSGDPINIAAIDIEKDIALLMKKTTNNNGEEVYTLNYPRGSINDLQWGSVVYIMGYPLGILMVTRAIVSLTMKVKKSVFVMDALYNKGISGSPVLAIRDGIPNFELIGIASSSAAQESNILIPEENYKNGSIIKLPYEGNIFVHNNKLISYGVTYSISIDEIITFIQSNEKTLKAAGFEINMFFK